MDSLPPQTASLILILGTLFVIIREISHNYPHSLFDEDGKSRTLRQTLSILSYGTRYCYPRFTCGEWLTIYAS